MYNYHVYCIISHRSGSTVVIVAVVITEVVTVLKKEKKSGFKSHIRHQKATLRLDNKRETLVLVRLLGSK